MSGRRKWPPNIQPKHEPKLYPKLFGRNLSKKEGEIFWTQFWRRFWIHENKILDTSPPQVLDTCPPEFWIHHAEILDTRPSKNWIHAGRPGPSVACRQGKDLNLWIIRAVILAPPIVPGPSFGRSGSFQDRLGAPKAGNGASNNKTHAEHNRIDV